jgi:hypothetical protein
MMWSAVVLAAGLIWTLSPQRVCDEVDTTQPDRSCKLPAIDYERGRAIGKCLARQVAAWPEGAGEGILEVSACQ